MISTVFIRFWGSSLAQGLQAWRGMWPGFFSNIPGSEAVFQDFLCGNTDLHFNLTTERVSLPHELRMEKNNNCPHPASIGYCYLQHTAAGLHYRCCCSYYSYLILKDVPLNEITTLAWWSSFRIVKIVDEYLLRAIRIVKITNRWDRGSDNQHEAQESAHFDISEITI